MTTTTPALPPEWAAAIDAAPTPGELFAVFGVLADWLDEHDDPWGAECLRWCGRAEIAPDEWDGHYLWMGTTAYRIPRAILGPTVGLLKAGDATHRRVSAYCRLMAAWRAARAAGERLPGDG